MGFLSLCFRCWHFLKGFIFHVENGEMRINIHNTKMTKARGQILHMKSRYRGNGSIIDFLKTATWS